MRVVSERMFVVIRVNLRVYKALLTILHRRMVRSVTHSQDRKVNIQCNCGNWVEADTEVSRVNCECGNVFAVTITDMGRK